MYRKSCAKILQGIVRKEVHLKVVCTIKVMMRIYLLESMCKKLCLKVVFAKKYWHALYFIIHTLYFITHNFFKKVYFFGIDILCVSFFQIYHEMMQSFWVHIATNGRSTLMRMILCVKSYQHMFCFSLRTYIWYYFVNHHVVWYHYRYHFIYNTYAKWK